MTWRWKNIYFSPGGTGGGGVRLDARDLPAEVAHPFEEETRAAADVEQPSAPRNG